jgi:hypothetical protein
MSNLSEKPAINPFATPDVHSFAKPQFPDVDLRQYASVRSGLQFIYYSVFALILIMILGVVLLGLLGMYSAAPNSGGNNAIATTAGVIMTLFGLGILTTLIASFIGLCRCTSCPNPNEKTLAITSVLGTVFYFIGSILSVLGGVGPVSQPVAIASVAGSLLGPVALFVGTIAFCLFLKRIGSNISSRRMKRSSHAALIWFILLNLVSALGFLLLGVLIFFAIGARPGGPPSTAGPAMVMFTIPFLIAVVVLGFGTMFQFLSMLVNAIHELKPHTDV